VNFPGHYFFSGAGLTGQQNGGVRLRHLLDELAHPAHLWAGSGKVSKQLRGARLTVQVAILSIDLDQLQRVLERGMAKRDRNPGDAAGVDLLIPGVDRPLSHHGYDGQMGLPGFDGPESFQQAVVRRYGRQDDYIDPVELIGGIGAARGGVNLRRVPEKLQHGAGVFCPFRVVVDDKGGEHA
jgi:hypothetical protein